MNVAKKLPVIKLFNSETSQFLIVNELDYTRDFTLYLRDGWQRVGEQGIQEEGYNITTKKGDENEKDSEGKNEGGENAESKGNSENGENKEEGEVKPTLSVGSVVEVTYRKKKILVEVTEVAFDGETFRAKNEAGKFLTFKTSEIETSAG